MPRDFYPRRESDILSFTANFSEKINANPEGYGTTPEVAAEYEQLQQAFAAAYLAANNPGGNSSHAFAVKETARIALEKATRPIAGKAKHMRSLSDAMLIQIGLKRRRDRRRQIPPPALGPIVRIAQTQGSTVTIWLLDASVYRKRRPRDVYGATFYGFVGNEPPASLRDWDHKGGTTRSDMQIRFNSSLPPGTKVWVTAQWFNRRTNHGPTGRAVYTYLGSGALPAPQLMSRAA